MKSSIKELVITKVSIDEDYEEITYRANDGNEKHEFILWLSRDDKNKYRHHVAYDCERNCYVIDEYTLNMVKRLDENEEIIDDREDNPIVITLSDETIDVFLKVLKAKQINDFLDEFLTR